ASVVSLGWRFYDSPFVSFTRAYTRASIVRPPTWTVWTGPGGRLDIVLSCELMNTPPVLLPQLESATIPVKFHSVEPQLIECCACTFVRQLTIFSARFQDCSGGQRDFFHVNGLRSVFVTECEER